MDKEQKQIRFEAQKNLTHVGYWRDVATGLSTLVDKLRTERSAERSAAMTEVERLQQELSEIHNALNLLHLRMAAPDNLIN